MSYLYNKLYENLNFMLVKWFNKVLAGKPDDLCSVSWSYMVEGKTLSSCPLTPQPMCTSVHMRTH